MEPLGQTSVIAIAEETDIAAARRTVRLRAERLALPELAVARAELVAVELARNLLHHGGGGRLFVGPDPSGAALTLVAADAGPGIANVPVALQDGWSTASTPGLGMGAVGRLAEQFDLYTEPGKGTVLAATVRSDRPADEPRAPIEDNLAVLTTSLEPGDPNGDAAAIFHAGGRDIFFLADGLGHGVHAAEASGLAVELAAENLRQSPDLPLDELLTRIHGPMHATRGAAVAVVAIRDGLALCCGAGNIACLLRAPDGTERPMISSNGTVGHQMRRVTALSYPCATGSLLVMHSDGLSSRWRFSQYLGLAARRPAVVAGVLYRDHARSRDDATVLVARPCPPPAGVPHA